MARIHRSRYVLGSWKLARYKDYYQGQVDVPNVPIDYSLSWGKSPSKQRGGIWPLDDEMLVLTEKRKVQCSSPFFRAK